MAHETFAAVVMQLQVPERVPERVSKRVPDGVYSHFLKS